MMLNSAHRCYACSMNETFDALLHVAIRAIAAAAAMAVAVVLTAEAAVAMQACSHPAHRRAKQHVVRAM